MLDFFLSEKIIISMILFFMMSIYYEKQKMDCTNAQMNYRDIILALSRRGYWAELTSSVISSSESSSNSRAKMFLSIVKSSIYLGFVSALALAFFKYRRIYGYWDFSKAFIRFQNGLKNNFLSNLAHFL